MPTSDDHQPSENAGVLVHVKSGRRYTLTSNHLVGRSRRCDLRLENELVSTNHASFNWKVDGWVLRDLGTTNGTFVDGRKLDTGGPAALRQGVRVAFGDTQDPYELASDGPPEAVAYGPAGQIMHAEDGYLALPSQDYAVLWVARHSDFGGWFIETEDGARRQAREEEMLDVGGARWRLELPSVLPPTRRPQAAGPRTIDQVGLRFVVSPDEEHIAIELIEPGGPSEPVNDRAHHGLLLALARVRLADQARADLPPSEHGWIEIEELLTTLDITRCQLDLDIHRARRQLHLEGQVSDSVRLIERRRGAKVRIGIVRLAIIDVDGKRR